ncbi:MAG: right-handed parallel beta-helix repeat-containing protein [Deltaproteobacteria bacterium]|nr:right-handed parallel beta-helix repeat-containing protein [Deltaproteobacteria bacterium]
MTGKRNAIIWTWLVVLLVGWGLLGCGGRDHDEDAQDGGVDAGQAVDGAGPVDDGGREDDSSVDGGETDGGQQDRDLPAFGYDPRRGADDSPINPYDGNTYYIAPDGDDDADGSENAPWATFAHANRVVTPGDLVLVRGGTYYEYVSLGGLDENPNGYCIGTEDQPIVWRAYPGEHVIFDGAQSTVPTGLFSLRSVEWVVVRDFEFHGSIRIGVALQHCKDVVLENIYSHDNDGSGIGCVDVQRVSFRFITTSDNFDTAGEGGNADGIAISSGSNNRFFRCVAHDNSDDGFDTWESSGNELVECVAYRNGKGAQGDGNGFKNGGGSAGGGNSIHHCIAFQNRTSGFASNTGSGNDPNTYFNNTGWNNGERGDFWLVNIAHVAKNNLAHGPNGVTVYEMVEDQANSWNTPPGITVSDADFLSVDPQDLDGDFLRLAPGSPEIDAGQDVGLPFFGAAPDLGAFESE